MNLGIVCNKFSRSGGMESYTLDLVRSFRKLGVSSIPIIAPEFDTSLPEFAFIKPVKITGSFLPRKLRTLYTAYQTGKLKKKLGIDMLIGCCRDRNADIICCGGTHPGFLKTANKDSGFHRFILKYEKECFANAKAVVAHSKLIEQEVAKYYDFPHSRIEVLYPPVSKKYLAREAAPLSSLPERPTPGKTSFLFVSSSHERKGFPLLEEFFENTDLPVELFVAGRPLPRSDYKNIRYLGFFKGMEKIYPLFDFSIMASQYEPFGLAPVEGIFSGIPAVLPADMGCAEILNGDMSITFDKNSEESLKNAVAEAVLNQNRMKKACARENLEPLIKMLDPDEHARKILELAKSLRP